MRLYSFIEQLVLLSETAASINPAPKPPSFGASYPIGVTNSLSTSTILLNPAAPNDSNRAVTDTTRLSADSSIPPLVPNHEISNQNLENLGPSTERQDDDESLSSQLSDSFCSDLDLTDTRGRAKVSSSTASLRSEVCFIAFYFCDDFSFKRVK